MHHACSHVLKCKTEEEAHNLNVDIHKYWVPLTRVPHPNVTTQWATDLGSVLKHDVNQAVLWWNSLNQPLVHYAFDQVDSDCIIYIYIYACVCSCVCVCLCLSVCA